MADIRGNLSAFGLLAVDWRTDHIATRVTHEDALDPAALAVAKAFIDRGLWRTDCR